mmetsp:Transcript_437/g.623  ORF Transcript_437/g.623 Transcript_437/m.623 type:complete len:218 (-) Transcript_437:688-1341(-)
MDHFLRRWWPVRDPPLPPPPPPHHRFLLYAFLYSDQGRPLCYLPPLSWSSSSSSYPSPSSSSCGEWARHQAPCGKEPHMQRGARKRREAMVLLVAPLSDQHMHIHRIVASPALSHSLPSSSSSRALVLALALLLLLQTGLTQWRRRRRLRPYLVHRRVVSSTIHPARLMRTLCPSPGTLVVFVVRMRRTSGKGLRNPNNEPSPSFLVPLQLPSPCWH